MGARPVALVLSGLLCLLAIPAEVGAQRLVLLVRHAERADGGVPPKGMTGPADPDLSAEGRARADRLSALLADSGITKILVTQFRRTVQTAEPLAKRLGVTPEPVTAADAPGLATRLAGYRDDVVLIIGHSNTVPAAIAALGGPTVTIDETDYSNLFLFVPATKVLVKLRY